jgi:hypothetical protein
MKGCNHLFTRSFCSPTSTFEKHTSGPPHRNEPKARRAVKGQDTADTTHAGAGDTGHSVLFQHTLELKTWMTNPEWQLNGKRRNDFPRIVLDQWRKHDT